METLCGCVLHQFGKGEPEARRPRRAFLCLLYNLLLLLEEKWKQEGIQHVAERQRKAKELAKAVAVAAQNQRKLPRPVSALQRLPQCSVKLLRW